MEKYIYKISHKKYPNKIYIGQTINPTERWKQHKSRTERYISLIHEAIMKYGEENFNFEVIEGPISNYNEREKYWIKYYHCYVHDKDYIDGYNLTPGGEEPPIIKGENNHFSHHTEEQVALVRYLLKETDFPLDKIAELTGYADATAIERINIGKIWKDENEKYPLRILFNSKIAVKQRWETIVDMLINTDLTQKEIADVCGVKRSCVTMINIGENGKQYNDGSIEYPIRKKPIKYKEFLEKAEKIQFDLLNTDMLQIEIAKKYNTNKSTVCDINNGRKAKNEKYIYPLRQKSVETILGETGSTSIIDT